MTNTLNLTPTEQAIINVLGADFPEAARVMNAAAICEESLCGRETILQDEDFPPVESYEEYEAALTELLAKELVTELDIFEMKAWSLTEAGRELVK